MRGNILGSLVTQIYDEVFELVKVFAECKYDPLDPGDPVSHGRNGVTLGGVGGVFPERKDSNKLSLVTESTEATVPVPMDRCMGRTWGQGGETAVLVI